MEIEPINININSDDELDSEVEGFADAPSYQHVHDSDVMYMNSQGPPLYQEPAESHSQLYMASQDSGDYLYANPSQIQCGWYHFDTTQIEYLTQDSGSSVISSRPLTQESYNSDQDDAMTVCDLSSQDSVCSFSTIASEATTVQGLSQQLSQPVADLNDFAESDIGAQSYFQQAYYGCEMPSQGMMAYPHQASFQADVNCFDGYGSSQADSIASNTGSEQEISSYASQLTLPEKSCSGNSYSNDESNPGHSYSNEECTPASVCPSQLPDPANTVVDGGEVVHRNDTPRPVLHLSEAGILSVLLRNNIAVEMTLDRAIRLVDHKHNMVIATTSQGDMSCLYHAAAKISNQHGVCEAELFWDRHAKFCPEGITFSCGSACYMLQSNHLEAVAPEFEDLSSDLSVTTLFSSSTYGPHIVPLLEAVVGRAKYRYHEDGLGVTVSINDVRVEQRADGDVFVEHGHKYLHMSPTRQHLHIDTPLSMLSVEKDWLVKVKYRCFNLVCGPRGMTLSDGMFDCGFNPYRRSFLRPAYFNVQTIILNGMSIRSDYRHRFQNRRRRGQSWGPGYSRRPEPDYSGRVQDLEHIIRRQGEPDEEYYPRLRAYRDRTEARQQPDTEGRQQQDSGESLTSDKQESVKREAANNHSGAAGDSIGHV